MCVGEPEAPIQGGDPILSRRVAERKRLRLRTLE